jgi:hypothetical protein
MSPKPVYWKPKYATRSMRHKAWVRQQAARDEALRRSPGFWQRVRAWLGRGV